MTSQFKGLISSDWNECLAPCGPFDVIAHVYPHLAPLLTEIFRQYTGNRISLGTAAGRIREMLPTPISVAQMDEYLTAAFRTYPGVAELMGWCRQNRVAFMINTTGMIGYFQRVFAGGRLPPVDVLSAHGLARYPSGGDDPPHVYELAETADKGVNTARAARRLGIASHQIVILGDSGGDGPHFAWGAEHGALLVGSMTKSSLEQYCRARDIVIHRRFGVAGDHAPDFRELIPWIEAFLQL